MTNWMVNDEEDFPDPDFDDEADDSAVSEDGREDQEEYQDGLL